MYISGWCRANWITSSGKSLVELKVPKVLLGHCGKQSWVSRVSVSPGSPCHTTYHARAGVWHACLVWHPLVVGALLVCKGAQERPADVGHGVDADGRALEDGAGERNGA